MDEPRLTPRLRTTVRVLARANAAHRPARWLRRHRASRRPPPESPGPPAGVPARHSGSADRAAMRLYEAAMALLAEADSRVGAEVEAEALLARAIELLTTAGAAAPPGAGGKRKRASDGDDSSAAGDDDSSAADDDNDEEDENAEDDEEEEEEEEDDDEDDEDDEGGDGAAAVRTSLLAELHLVTGRIVEWKEPLRALAAYGRVLARLFIKFACQSRGSTPPSTGPPESHHCARSRRRARELTPESADANLQLARLTWKVM